MSTHSENNNKHEQAPKKGTTAKSTKPRIRPANVSLKVLFLAKHALLGALVGVCDATRETRVVCGVSRVASQFPTMRALVAPL